MDENKYYGSAIVTMPLVNFLCGAHSAIDIVDMCTGGAGWTVDPSAGWIFPNIVYKS